jgi:hypothetical protein
MSCEAFVVECRLTTFEANGLHLVSFCTSGRLSLACWSLVAAVTGTRAPRAQRPLWARCATNSAYYARVPSPGRQGRFLRGEDVRVIHKHAY